MWKIYIISTFYCYLLSSGIKENNIVNINLESLDNSFKDYMELYNFIKEKIKDEDKYYVFIDEVQVIDKWKRQLIVYI